MEELYSSKQVADILGVNESSVKRWADSGDFKCFKTPGGHRKFNKSHIYDFANKYSYNIPELNSLSAPQQPEIPFSFNGSIEILFKKLLNSDEKEVLEFIYSFYARGIPLYTIFDDLIKPCMTKIGEYWFSGRLKIDDEHVASYNLMKSIILLNDKISPAIPNGLKAVCGCLGKENHEIGILIMSNVLKIEGWNVVFLGSNLPVESFSRAIKTHKPDLVCVSTTYTTNPKIFLKDMEKLYETSKKFKAKLILGGENRINAEESKHCDKRTKSIKEVYDYLNENFPVK